MLRRPLRRRLSECPSCKNLSFLSTCLARATSRHVCFMSRQNGAIIAAATANSRRLSQQNPYKTCVSLVELGRTSPSFFSTFEKNPNKNRPQAWALCQKLRNRPRISILGVHIERVRPHRMKKQKDCQRCLLLGENSTRPLATS